MASFDKGGTKDAFVAVMSAIVQLVKRVEEPSLLGTFVVWFRLWSMIVYALYRNFGAKERKAEKAAAKEQVAKVSPAQTANYVQLVSLSSGVHRIRK